MGTLTGDMPSLSEHCPHKLPTSCRLTATTLCCACQDKRPHSTTYSIYVDGIGLVMRGTRWQRYCWFCKEFWYNRTASTDPPIEPSQTRVPDVPDQTEFLERWFEYHRGYRVQKNNENDTEEKIPIPCEKPWRDVAPGHLPVLDPAERRMVQRIAARENSVSVAHQSLDNTLDDLLAEAEEEDVPENEEGEANTEALSAQAQTAARVRDEEAIRQMEQTLNEAANSLTATQHRRDQLARELEAAESEVRTQRDRHWRLSRERRTAQQLARIFGTREEIEQQGSEYVSPLTTMFTRAYERYSVAEEVRAVERASDVHSERYQQLLARMNQMPGFRPRDRAAAVPAREEEELIANLDDEDILRPPPKSEEEMIVKLACKICLQQRADIAVLPCGHLIMCSYCADAWAPVKENDPTQLLRKTQCPMCRKQIRRRVKIFTS